MTMQLDERARDILRANDRGGYTVPNGRVRSDTRALMEGAGFYESYCPISGRGTGGGDFSWTAAMWLQWARSG